MSTRLTVVTASRTPGSRGGKGRLVTRRVERVQADPDLGGRRLRYDSAAPAADASDTPLRPDRRHA